MKYNLLGNTGLRVSELCLGTMTFGGGNGGMWASIGQVPQDDVNGIIKMAVAAGINFIDTANVYSFGQSEEFTGRGIKALGLKRDELVIATKVRGKMGEGPNDTGLSRKHIIQQAEESLKRLGTDYIDLYQIHGFDPLTPFEEILSALNDLVRQGKVRYIGCSNHAAWQIMKALGISEKHGYAKFVSLQAYYTVAGRDLERELAPLLKDQHLGLMVWSPLAGGLLSGKYNREGNDDKNSRRGGGFDFPPVDKDRAFNIIDRLRPMAEQKKASVAQLAIAWLLHQKVVTTVILGAKNTDQLKDNLGAVDVQLTPDELQQLDEVSAMPREYPGWMIERQGADRR